MTRQNYYDYEFSDTARYIENVPSGVSQLADDLYEAVYSLDDYIAVNGNITEDDTLIAIDLMRQKHPRIFYLEFANTETDEDPSHGNRAQIQVRRRPSPCDAG